VRAVGPTVEGSCPRTGVCAANVPSPGGCAATLSRKRVVDLVDRATRMGGLGLGGQWL
jgi:hypothetical protein